MAAVQLSDYRPAPFLLERTDLTVRLHASHALVEARLTFLPNPQAPVSGGEALVLMGVDLDLEDLRLDGSPLAAEAFELQSDRLLLTAPPQRPFVLESRVRITPHTNTTL